ncbi:uncharacterized protein TNCT_422041 [Trichonephila clavata]|uniref:Pre-C2HC domain-containing protein n=1 Tax=Trichonephila clavata TaxID=2740835 RepID=A0A8X6GUL2_TRICU|nr:uncharacterized protein TNCT_422041 [Trichonephila clavata]
MMEIDKKSPTPLPETMPQLESELKNLEDNFLEGKTREFLPYPIALCRHNYKFKAVKRPADPILRPSKLTASVSKNLKNKNNEFSFPKKPAKIVPVENNLNQIKTTNSFAALSTAKSDAENVTPDPSKVKPIMMRMTTSYNLILQELHRTYPTATNTHINGFIKIVAETEDDHRAITSFLTTKMMQYYVMDPPPSDRPLKLVIKGLPSSTEPEEIKNDLIAKGIKIEKVAQLRKFATKALLPFYMIRDN